MMKCKLQKIMRHTILPPMQSQGSQSQSRDVLKSDGKKKRFALSGNESRGVERIGLGMAGEKWIDR